MMRQSNFTPEVADRFYNLTNSIGCIALAIVGVVLSLPLRKQVGTYACTALEIAIIGCGIAAASVEVRQGVWLENGVIFVRRHWKMSRVELRDCTSVRWAIYGRRWLNYGRAWASIELKSGQNVICPIRKPIDSWILLGTNSPARNSAHRGYRELVELICGPSDPSPSA